MSLATMPVAPNPPVNDAQREEISCRINILRYLMIVGIVFLHVPPYVPVEEIGPHPFDWFKGWIQLGVFRASVPVLTCISGYLLFRTGLDRDFPRLFRKKTHTLLIPLIFFNLIVAIPLALVQYQGFLEHDFSRQLYPPTFLGWLNALTGLWGTPANYALGFLRNLYVIGLLAPLIGWLLRRCPLSGFILMFVVMLWDLDGWLITRNTMLINFYVGGLAAIYHWDLRRLDNCRIPALMLFLLLTALVVAWQIQDLKWLRIVAPILVWPASSLLFHSRLATPLVALSSSSFFIYVLHAPLLFGCALIYNRILAAEVPYWVFWWTTPLLLVLLLRLLHQFGSARFPGTSQLLLGGR